MRSAGPGSASPTRVDCSGRPPAPPRVGVQQARALASGPELLFLFSIRPPCTHPSPLRVGLRATARPSSPGPSHRPPDPTRSRSIVGFIPGGPAWGRRRWLEDVCCWGATSCRLRRCSPSRRRRCRPSRRPRLSQCWSSGAIATKVTGSGLCDAASSVGTCTAIPGLPSTSS